VEAEPEPLILRALGLDEALGPLYRGAGCRHCRNTGYAQRVGIYELLPVSDAVRTQIVTRADTRKIRDCAIEEGMVRLRDDGLAKAFAGVTTLAEVARVAADGD
jgi:type II secretory ATPase GspE/PulE/Tfp pilus assembly ATPase PilB-like protein